MDVEQRLHSKLLMSIPQPFLFPRTTIPKLKADEPTASKKMRLRKPGLRSNLILLSEVLLLSLSLGGFSSDLFVILLKGGKILSGFGELSLLHTLSDVPMDEGSLGVHKIELVVNSGKGLSDGSGVSNQAYGSLNSGKISSWDNGWRLVVNTALESGWTPVDELDGSLGLDGGYSGVDVLRDDISSVHKTTGHVLSVSWVTLGHHTGRFEDGVGDLRDRKLLVVGLLGRDDWSIRGQHKVDSWVRNQVSLELSDINVKGSIESEGGGKGGDNLGDQSVKIGVSWSLDIKVSSTDVIKGLVIHAESAISVFQKGVSRKDGVVWFNDGGRDLRGWGDGERKLGLSSVINGKSLQKEGSKTGSGSSSGGVEAKESLESGTVVGQLTDSVKDKVDNLLTDGVMSTGVVIGGIFLSGDDLLRVVKLSVGTRSDFVTDGWLKIDVDGSWDVLSGTSFREKGVEGIVSTSDSLVGWHLTIRLDSVL